MNKIYKLSKRNDVDVELTIFNLSRNQLKVFAYGIARGWDFDETLELAENLKSAEIVEEVNNETETKNS